MSMTAEEKRIAKNEASRRWYAKHKSANAKPETPAENTAANPEPEAEAAPDDVENDDMLSEIDENNDLDEDMTYTDDLDGDDVDEWVAGREEMFREFGAQGYMEED